MSELILAINPGSTSTKISVFRDDCEIAEKVIRHDPEVLVQYDRITDQKEMRLNSVVDFLEEVGIESSSLSAIVGRGGILKPIESGTYLIDDSMLADLYQDKAASHASVFGGLLAYEIGKACDVPAFVVDPVVVDEMIPQTKLTGFPGIERDSIFHALNTKAIARRCASELGRTYEDSNFVMAHMGGGISVSAHKQGKVIDVNNAVNGEGPFTPERCGGVPLKHVIELCFSGTMDKTSILAMLNRNGGVSAYLGTSDMREVETMIQKGNEEALLVVQSMAYQISKEIGAMAAALSGEVDAIILTGGLAYSERIVDLIAEHVHRLGEIKVYPGEDEMSALALGALRVLRKEQQAKTYEVRK